MMSRPFEVSKRSSRKLACASGFSSGLRGRIRTTGLRNSNYLAWLPAAVKLDRPPALVGVRELDRARMQAVPFCRGPPWRTAMRFRTLAPSLLALCLLAPASARAHDIWLLPGRSAVEPGSTVTLELTSGMAFPRNETAIKPERLASAAARLAGETAELAGRKPAGGALRLTARLDRPGVAALWIDLTSWSPTNRCRNGTGLHPPPPSFTTESWKAESHLLSTTHSPSCRPSLACLSLASACGSSSKR